MGWTARAHSVGAAALLLVFVSTHVEANTTGNARVQGEAIRTISDSPGGAPQATSALLLIESIQLRHIGPLFGDDVAIVSLGAGFTNVHGSLVAVGSAGSRSIPIDASIGLLPRRGVPLRLFGRATLVQGDRGTAGSLAVGPNIGYGGSLNLDQSILGVGLRVDFEETRTSGFPGTSGAPDAVQSRTLSDIRRNLNTAIFRSIGEHNLNLTIRTDAQRRPETGGFDAYSGSLSWGAPEHRSSLNATEVRRLSPDLAGIVNERSAILNHEHRFGRRLSASFLSRATEAEAGGRASGRQVSTQTTVAGRPLESHDVSLSASANVGYSETASTTSPISGTTAGASMRAGYGRNVGPLYMTVFTGGGADTCQCDFGNDGTLARLDAGMALRVPGLDRMTLSADYAIGRVFAPATRGGNNLEQRARASASRQLSSRMNLNTSLEFADALRELLDISTGGVQRIREQTVSASGGFRFGLPRGSIGADVRHLRGRALTSQGPFVSGTPSIARMITSGSLSANYILADWATARAQLGGSWIDLTPPTRTIAMTAGAGIEVSFGQFRAHAEYRFRWTEGNDQAYQQHEVRTVLSRALEI